MSTTKSNVFNLNTSFLKNITISQNTLFLNNQDSYNNTTGGVVMYGGLGISKNLNIGGNLNINDNLIVNKKIHTQDNIILYKQLQFSSNNYIDNINSNNYINDINPTSYIDNINSNITISSNNIHILPSDKVGIGTTNPYNLLDIYGNIGIKEGSYISYGTNTLDNSYGIRDDSGVIQFKNNNDQWRNISASLWDSNNHDIYYNKGNVSITNNLYCNTLHSDNITIDNNINLEGNMNVQLNLNINDTLCVSNIKTNTTNHHILDKNNNEIITIKESGLIGIGTIYPQNTLHISGTNTFTTPTTTGIHAGLININNSQLTLAKKNINSSNIIDFYDINNTKYERIESIDNSLKFYTNSTPQVIINSDGCVGIGTDNPNCALSICSDFGDDRITEKGIHFISPILNYQRIEFVSAGFSNNNYYHGILEFKNINNELDNDYEERIITYKNNGIRTIELDSEAVVIIGTTHTFTGSHFAILSSEINNYSNDFTEYDENAPNNLIFKRGLILSARDSTYISINNSIFNVELANSDNDKQVIGVFSNNYYPPEHERLHINSNASINSIGEGAIWVTNINGNIESGDYITSSIIPGYGKKQDDDLLHNYTVAKCITNINWNNISDTITYNNNTYKKIFVACTYHCG